MPQPFEKIIILGNSGFIGTHLEAALKKSNSRIEITGFSSSDLNLLRKQEALRLQSLIDDHILSGKFNGGLCDQRCAHPRTTDQCRVFYWFGTDGVYGFAP